MLGTLGSGGVFMIHYRRKVLNFTTVYASILFTILLYFPEKASPVPDPEKTQEQSCILTKTDIEKIKLEILMDIREDNDSIISKEIKYNLEGYKRQMKKERENEFNNYKSKIKEQSQREIDTQISTISNNIAREAEEYRNETIVENERMKKDIASTQNLIDTNQKIVEKRVDLLLYQAQQNQHDSNVMLGRIENQADRASDKCERVNDKISDVSDGIQEKVAEETRGQSSMVADLINSSVSIAVNKSALWMTAITAVIIFFTYYLQFIAPRKQ